jgi:hypothetical protein
MLVIGKTGGYFNLFDVVETEVYEAPFKYKVLKKNFIKKLATSQKKAERLVTEEYGIVSVKVDVSLKGQHSYEHKDYNSKTFVSQGDETPIWFGKYKGKKLAEVITQDPGYIEYLLTTDNELVEAIKNSETWKKHLAKKQVELNTINSKVEKLDYDDVIEVTFQKNLKVGDGKAWYEHTIGDLSVRLFFKHYKEYYYAGYAYAMPVIRKGKQKSGRRIKGQTFQLKVNPITFGESVEKRVWDNDKGSYVTKVVVEQDVRVVGMKLVS